MADLAKKVIVCKAMLDVIGDAEFKVVSAGKKYFVLENIKFKNHVKLSRIGLDDVDAKNGTGVLDGIYIGGDVVLEAGTKLSFNKKGISTDTKPAEKAKADAVPARQGCAKRLTGLANPA